MREVRKRSYDIMKFNLEKRLSDAELPILWARLCMVSSCYSLMAKSCRVNTRISREWHAIEFKL
jgi:hypothetical protein